jgi:hypothetical protein
MMTYDNIIAEKSNGPTQPKKLSLLPLQAMTKFMNDPFAECSAKPKKKSARAGRHTKASQALQNGRSQKEVLIMVPKNRKNKKLKRRANIVTWYFNKNMKQN